MRLTSQQRAITKYQDSINGSFSLFKASANTRRLTVSLTLEEYTEIRRQPCSYCGLAISQKVGGLDRVDNEKGYLPDNVVPCCRECNRIKSDKYTQAETKAMIEALHRFRSVKIISIL